MNNEIRASKPVQRMEPFIHTQESMLEDLQVTSGILFDRIQALEARAVKQNEMIELLAAKTTQAVEQVASALRQIIDQAHVTAQHVKDLESKSEGGAK